MRLFVFGLFPGCFSCSRDFHLEGKLLLFFFLQKISTTVSKILRFILLGITFFFFCPLHVVQEYMEHCSVFDDASPMRLMAEHKKHKNLKNVTMIGFCSAKSMVELTCHILESTTSLECITLDTIVSWYENEEDIIDRCCVRGTRRRECLSIGTEMILEAHRAILAIERYILGKVPAAVRLDVHRPCTRCHTV